MDMPCFFNLQLEGTWRRTVRVNEPWRNGGEAWLYYKILQHTRTMSMD